ncbi:hypothetical protein PO909_028582 [Leuciscus waleckii]
MSRDSPGNNKEVKMLRICQEEDVCLYCLNARRGGKFEWPKTLQGSQMENCRD